MIVISDASPLIGLAHIGHLDLLRDLYGEVIIPEAVFSEVVVRRADRPGAAEVRQAKWISVHAVAGRELAEALQNELGQGESEAIALAVELPEALLLVDEHRARRIATGMGVEIIGTMGVLTRARRAGLIPEIRPLLDELVRGAGFRINPRLYRLVLERESEL